MQHDVVRRRARLTEEHLLDLVRTPQLIPGPNSTELALHVVWARRRHAGLRVLRAIEELPRAWLFLAAVTLLVRFKTGATPLIFGGVLAGLALPAAGLVRS